MEIKIAGQQDLETIQQLADKIWRTAYKGILSDEQIELMLGDMYSIASLTQQTHQGATFILALDKGEAIGFASFTPDDPGYKIHKLYILSSRQGKGVGSRLLNIIEAEAKEGKARFLELNVNRNNPALHFYQRAGFSILKEVDIPYYHFILNDYVMRKNLAQS